jgi:hypothetical protein
VGVTTGVEPESLLVAYVRPARLGSMSSTGQTSIQIMQSTHWSSLVGFVLMSPVETTDAGG